MANNDAIEWAVPAWLSDVNSMAATPRSVIDPYIPKPMPKPSMLMESYQEKCTVQSIFLLFTDAVKLIISTVQNMAAT